MTTSTEGKRPSESKLVRGAQGSKRASLEPLDQIRQLLGNRVFGQLIQAKLRISQPEDAQEQEADRLVVFKRETSYCEP